VNQEGKAISDIGIAANVDANGNATGANNFLCSIIDQYEQAQERNKEVCAAYETQVAELKSRVARIMTAEDANAFVDEMRKEQFVFNGKLVISSALQARCNELGLVFNKESKTYAAA